MPASTTAAGARRDRYAAIEPRPSRFANNGRDYRAWAARADSACLGCLDPHNHPHAFDCDN